MNNAEGQEHGLESNVQNLADVVENMVPGNAIAPVNVAQATGLAGPAAAPAPAPEGEEPLHNGLQNGHSVPGGGGKCE